MMKRNSVTVMLVGLLALSVMVSLVLCYQYVRTLAYVLRVQASGQQLQTQLGLANRNRAIVQAMVNDAVEYSKRNPAINPLLQQYHIKPTPGQTPAVETPLR